MKTEVVYVLFIFEFFFRFAIKRLREGSDGFI